MEHASVYQKLRYRASMATLAALFSLGAAGLHLMAAPEHLEEWSGYGAFFLAVASLQAIYGVGLLVAQGRAALSPWYLLAGILGSLLVMAVYAVSRTLGVPLLGPHAGHVEALGAVDVLSTALELGLVAVLAGLLLRVVGFEARFWTRATFALGGTLLLIVALVLATVSTSGHSGALAASAQSEILSAAGAPTDTLPALRELLPLLTRSGWGPPSAAVDLIYAPPFVFQVTGDEVPAVALERPTLIFVMAEADHDHIRGLTPQPPLVLLRVDGGKPIEPYETAVQFDGSEHRTTQLLFPLPPGLDPKMVDQEKHTLAVSIPLGAAGESTFTWHLPLDLGGRGGQASSPARPIESKASASARGVTRARDGVAYGGREGITVQATYATPAYFQAALPVEAGLRYLPDRFAAFAVSETAHAADLPADLFPIALRLDGRAFQPDMVERLVTSPHHRVTLVRFPVAPPDGLRHRAMELVLPQGERLVWHFPVIGTGADTPSGFRLTSVSLLAVMGGLVAAMWPCLFQLTVFFIPALAGVSMGQARSDVGFLSRTQVFKAALFFVLGFVLVYTAAGALIGFAAQRLADAPNFGLWQRYLGVGGGAVIILLALRVAAKVRAPLVCQMPVLSRMAHKRGPANHLEMMFAGLAFATGCMTCFGAALVVAMVVYVGLSGSAAFGALTLFLFSLGMGIPLVIAATAMAKVLPLLFRLEKAVRWMGLASSLIMVGFGVLLITGNYMALTEWVYRLLPPLGIR